MDYIADILLAAGALGAAFYCFVLSRRLTRFNDLENGVGGAVAVLSAQVDDLTKTLKSAQAAAGNSSNSLIQLTERAESVAKRLELLVASMHDLPEPGSAPKAARAEPAPAPRPEPPAPVVQEEKPSLPDPLPDNVQPVFARRRG